MFLFLISLALIILGVGSLSVARWSKKNKASLTEEGKNILLYGGIGVILVGFILLLFNVLYTQGIGESSVLVSFTGEVRGVDASQGLRVKLPWDSREIYNVRNNVISFAGTAGANDNYVGGSANGPQITFQDKEGVTGNIDISVRYSLQGEKVQSIYEGYKTQEEFSSSVLANDIRSQVREVLSKYPTSKVYGERELIKDALIGVLGERWSENGVEVEDVYLQEVRYPENVVNAFASAQSAKAMVNVAKANQEQAKIEAETNLIKSKALTDAVLKEKMIDAIRNGTGTYIIDTEKLSVGVK